MRQFFWPWGDDFYIEDFCKPLIFKGFTFLFGNVKFFLYYCTMKKTKKQKEEEFYIRALGEMFRRVGFEGYDEEFAQQPYWYTLREWALKDDVDFTKWFIDEYSKELKVPKYEAKEVAGMFIFNYGWKIRKEHDKIDGFVR